MAMLEVLPGRVYNVDDTAAKRRAAESIVRLLKSCIQRWGGQEIGVAVIGHDDLGREVALTVAEADEPSLTYTGDARSCIFPNHPDHGLGQAALAAYFEWLEGEESPALPTPGLRDHPEVVISQPGLVDLQSAGWVIASRDASSMRKPRLNREHTGIILCEPDALPPAVIDGLSLETVIVPGNIPNPRELHDRAHEAYGRYCDGATRRPFDLRL